MGAGHWPGKRVFDLPKVWAFAQGLEEELRYHLEKPRAVSAREQ